MALHTKSAFDIVAIGTSAGGFHGVPQLLAGLPGDFPAAIVVVQHLSSHHPTNMPEYWGKFTKLPVTWARSHTRLSPGMVYVAPPDYHLLLNRNSWLTLEQSPKKNFARPAVDPLFISVAGAFGERAIGVVLTGRGQDGAAGVRAIKQAGGRVLVQDQATSCAWDMPRAAIRTGCVDFVLPLTTITSALISLVMAPGAADFFRVFPPARGTDWPSPFSYA